VGESARVRLEAGVEGRRNFSGTIRGAKDGHVEIACDGRSYDLPIDDIVRANLIPDWDREFARAGEAGPGGSSKRPSKLPTSNNRSAS
jgi:hypothetical protein